MDAGGRVTHGAVTERAHRKQVIHRKGAKYARKGIVYKNTGLAVARVRGIKTHTHAYFTRE
jgi:hypothetical protein